jgi:dual specificity phosphatase 12
VDSADQRICDHFETATAFIAAALGGDGCVLVHCKHGQSRSATIVAAYLMHTQHRDLAASAAVSKLVAVRSRISPNPGFAEQLGVMRGAAPL